MMAVTTIPTRLRRRSLEEERAEREERERVAAAANVFELDPTEARRGLISRAEAGRGQEQAEAAFRFGAAGIQPTPGVPLEGTLEPGPEGSIWLRRYTGPAESKIRPLILEKLSNYSPEDQKNIKQILQDRSRIAQSPDLSPADRQVALDLKDAQLSTIPKAPPILQEPDAQEQLETRNVKGPDGRDYYLDHQGNPKPYEVDNAEQEEQNARRDFILKRVEQRSKEQADVAFTGDKVSTSVMAQEAASIWDTVNNPMREEDSFIQELQPLWLETMQLLDTGKKVSEQQMLDAMENYALQAQARGVPAEDARNDFLQHWQSALGGGDQYSPIVPNISKRTQQVIRDTATDSVRRNDPDARQEPRNIEDLSFNELMALAAGA
jgi:hypothetical protein